MKQSICALGMFAAFCAFGCSGSDDDGGGGTGGTSSGTGGSSSSTGGSSTGTGTCKAGMDASVASTSAANACCLLCIKEDPCDAGTKLDDCAAPGGYRHCDELVAAAPACASAIKAYFDCLRAEADVCMPGPACDDESITALTACGG
jgi:hypothetical protein